MIVNYKSTNISVVKMYYDSNKNPLFSVKCMMTYNTKLQEDIPWFQRFFFCTKIVN